MSGNDKPGITGDNTAPRLRVENARKLPVGAISRMLSGASGSFALQWRAPTTGAVDYELRVAFALSGDKAGLRLSCDPGSVIRMQAIPQPRGGRRWRFVDHTGVRCAVLYQPSGESRFASRETWGLSYNSQSTSPRRRAERKAARIRRELGGSADLAASFPARPAGMHAQTYDRRRAQAEAAAAVALTGRPLPSTERQAPTPARG